jgi:hypothetical protein
MRAIVIFASLKRSCDQFSISFDAVKQLVIAKVEHRTANLDLGHYPYLPAANVKTTSAADYMVLVSGRAA